MSFTTTGAQTGTDTDCTGLTAITGTAVAAGAAGSNQTVCRLAGGTWTTTCSVETFPDAVTTHDEGRVTVYDIPAGIPITVAGTWSINPEIERVVFKQNRSG